MIHSIKTKIILPTVLTIAVVVMIFVLVIYFAVNNSVKQSGDAIVETVTLGINNLQKADTNSVEAYINFLQSQVNDSVVFAAVVDEQGQIIAATQQENLADIGFQPDTFKKGEQTEFAGKYNGKKVTHYVKSLNNGEYLAISVSNAILTFIVLATLIAGTIAISIVLFILWLTTGRQAKRILHVRDALIDISNGDADLTKRMHIQTTDEIGQLMQAANDLVHYFQNIIKELQHESLAIQQATGNISTLANETLSLSKELEQGSIQVEKTSNAQLISMTESAIAMEELAQGIQHISEAILEIAHSSQNAEQHAESGAQVLTDLLKQLKIVYEKTADSVNRSQSLAELSNKIAEFTNVISAISEQTNLLALNASIEAARAGEAGKGFAVVAEEVRKLAVESKGAADRITAVMFDIQEETGEIVELVRHTEDVLLKGREIANHAHESFNEIVSGVKHVATQVESVSSASEQMAASTEEISATFDDITTLSKQTVTQTNEMVTLTKTQFEDMEKISQLLTALFSISDQLNDSTGKYKV